MSSDSAASPAPKPRPGPAPSLTRDLISVGVFTALYFVVVAVFGQLGGLVPVTQVFGPFYIPLLCGIPFMLFLTRVHRFGMITAMGWIVGLLLMATGMHWTVLVIALILAPLADLVARLGGYKRWWPLVASYVVFSEILIGTVWALFFQREAVLGRLSTRHDSTWINQIVALTPPWMFYVMVLMIVAGAVIGAFIGRAVFRKHYRYLSEPS